MIRHDVHVELVKFSASDNDVIAAARVSTVAEASLDTYEDHAPRSAGLINYLMRDRHGSPFEHTSFTFFIKAPILVFREFHRHRAGWSYNEESGRYRQLEPVFYIPGPDRPLVQHGKPGAYEFSPGTDEQHHTVDIAMRHAYTTAYTSYEKMLDAGVAREVARAVLPVGLYSSMYATCNARSLMHFLSLRTKNPAATVPSFPQREIEMVAEQMEEIFAGLMPITHEAFSKHGRAAP